MITVYLDTSFYVYLQRADAELALSVVHQLRALDVRRVESFELLVELDASPNRDGKQTLVERLAGWSIEPLRLGGADLRWLATEELPKELAKLREANAQANRAHAFAASATQTRSMSSGDKALLTEASHRELGIEQAAGSNRENLRAMKPVLEMMENAELPPSFVPLVREMRALYDGVDCGKIDDETAAKTAASFPARFAAAAETAMPGINREREIRNSVLTSNERAISVAVGKASEKAEKRHASTIADLGHLSVFLRNLDDIDFLMMDAPQLTAVDQRAGDQIREVRSRIFIARDLAGVVGAIKELGTRSNV